MARDPSQRSMNFIHIGVIAHGHSLNMPRATEAPLISQVLCSETPQVIETENLQVAFVVN